MSVRYLKWDTKINAGDTETYNFSSEHSEITGSVKPDHWVKMIRTVKSDDWFTIGIDEKECSLNCTIEPNRKYERDYQAGISCASCGYASTKRCPCGRVVYCDVTCQRNHWNAHQSDHWKFHQSDYKRHQQSNILEELFAPPTDWQPNKRVLIKIDSNVAEELNSSWFGLKQVATRIKLSCDNTSIKFIIYSGSEVFVTMVLKAKHLLTYENSKIFGWDFERLIWIGHLKDEDSRDDGFCWFSFLPKDIISKIIGKIHSVYSITGEISAHEFGGLLGRNSSDGGFSMSLLTNYARKYTKNIIFEIDEAKAPGKVRMKLEPINAVGTRAPDDVGLGVADTAPPTTTPPTTQPLTTAPTARETPHQTTREGLGGRLRNKRRDYTKVASRSLRVAHRRVGLQPHEPRRSGNGGRGGNRCESRGSTPR